MADKFDVFIKDNNFTSYGDDNLGWKSEGSYGWEYILQYEGYAFVFNQRVNTCIF